MFWKTKNINFILALILTVNSAAPAGKKYDPSTLVFPSFLHTMGIRKATKTRGAFPTDQAALKLLFLAARNAEKTWRRPFPGWVRSRAQFAIQFEGRMP